jgi:DNA-binding CsgD family transcriptional regulator
MHSRSAEDAHTAIDMEGDLLRIVVRALTAREPIDSGAGPLLGEHARAARLLVAKATWVAEPADSGAFLQALDCLRITPGEGLAGLAWEHCEVRSDLNASAAGAMGLRRGSQGGLCAIAAVPARTRDKAHGVVGFYAGPNTELDCAGRFLRAMGPTAHLLGSLVKRWRLQGIRTTLTERELEMLALASTGNTTARIADRLSLSPWTVKTHFENIRLKLGVPDRTAAVAYAIRAGMIG